jgi:predicted  nucleic acid-binding Zn-ribbon protein
MPPASIRTNYHRKNFMLTATKLEKIMELEDNLRAEYQAKLETKSAELEQCKQELADQREKLQATIDQQLETIADLSGKATANQHVEQLNRELTNRGEKLQEEAASLKKRVKGLQKDLADARKQVSALTQYDPARMKKNLDANKKKLAEKSRTNDLLQKSLNKTKAENTDLKRKVEELESKLAGLDSEDSAEQEAA